MDLLLLSNSTAPGRPYLAHAADAVLELAAGRGPRVAFVPYALADHDAYTRQVAEALAPLGLDVVGVHAGDPVEVVRDAGTVFVGGGNTFRLVDALHRTGLLDAVRAAVAGGTGYLGSSAGTNIAAPTLRTTNDMPIVEPPGFGTLALVPFQINPHYLDPVPGDLHQGETREERIRQFHEESAVPVVGLREGTWLRRRDGVLTLGGSPAGARLFRAGEPAVELAAGADLSDLLR
ncbi:MAG TPA: dipeptidase PepE [Cellulomonas sp.]